VDRRGLARLLIGDLSLLRLALSVALVYGVLCLLAWLLADRMIFLPPAPSYRDGPDIVRLETRSGERIAAIHVPNPEARYTLLYSHGNAEDLGFMRPFLPALRDLGFAVLIYDYRGYGLSEGRPSERASYEDIDAAYEYLTGRLGVPPDRIIAFGRSVGAGPTLDLAVRQPVAGLVLESPFVTAFRVLTRWPLLPFDKFRNLDKIRQVRRPVLIMHGEADEVVPAWHGRQLFQAAPGPKQALWVPRASHNDFAWVAGSRYGRALQDFARLVADGR
jgi:fermentation-respiration switch protein FrsA (DUF1100 family)